MKKEKIKAKVADLIINEGQLGWLPTNPRQWTREDVEKTKASLENDADFTEERPVLVVACDGKLLVFAGNLRTTAARALKWEYISAVLYTPENDEDKDTIKRRSILDNGAFGSWDYDMLANEWDDLPLSDWGVDGIPTEANVSATELLSTLEYDPLYYEPKNKPDIKLSDCYDLTKFNAKVAALDEYDLTPAQKEVMKKWETRLIRKKIMNTTFYDLRYVYRGEKGVQDDDTSQFVNMMNEGYLAVSLATGLVLCQMPSATQKGGLTDLYNENKLLNKAVVCPIQFPSCIRGEKQKQNGNRLHHKCNYRYLMPYLVKGKRSNIAWDTYPEDGVFTCEPLNRRGKNIAIEE